MPSVWQVLKNRFPKVCALCANMRPALGCPSYLQDLGKTEITLALIISSMFSSNFLGGGSVWAQRTVRMLSRYCRSGPQLPGAGFSDPHGSVPTWGILWFNLQSRNVSDHTLRTSSNPIAGTAGWWQHPLIVFTFPDNLLSQQRFTSTGNASVALFEFLPCSNTPNTS